LKLKRKVALKFLAYPGDGRLESRRGSGPVMLAMERRFKAAILPLRNNCFGVRSALRWKSGNFSASTPRQMARAGLHL
jgi:hypothetical protein